MEDLQGLQEFIEALQNTTSRKEKEEILSKATEFQKRVLEFLYNPYKVTGISKKKLNVQEPIRTGSGVSLLPLLRYLEVHSTGSKKDIDYVREVAGETGFTSLIYSIARKDITLGVNATTLNKVFGKGFIPTFGVMLACKYFDNPDELVPEHTEFLLTEKLDGVRCVLVFGAEGEPHFYTRSGREIQGLIELQRDARKLDKKYVYDGELLAEAEGTSNTLYRDTMSIVGSDRIKKGIRFNVFDIISKECFEKGYYGVPAFVRKALVESNVKGQHIVPLPILYRGTDKKEIDKWLSWAHNNGKEGIMINIANAPYVTNRTKDLLKVKTFNECEAVVRSIETGTGRNSKCLGAVIVEIKDSNNNYHRVRVGSGFTDEQRQYYFKHPKDILNKVVEIGYFEVTHNKGDEGLSLRFPTWLDRVRTDKAFEDMTAI